MQKAGFATIPLGKITASFLLVKAIQIGVVLLTSVRFDTSSEILINKHESSAHVLDFAGVFSPLLRKFLDRMVTWDMVHFSDMFVNEPVFEHQFVFCPNWLALIRELPLWHGNFYGKLLLSILLSNVAHYLTSIIAYYYTKRFFQKKLVGNSDVIDRFSGYVSLLMVISAGGVFQTTGYSENLSNLLTMLTMILRDYSLDYQYFKHPSNKYVRNIPLYVLSGTILALNFTIRANSTLLGFFYVYDLCQFAILDKDVRGTIVSILGGVQLFFSIVNMHYKNYQVFCPARGEWCNDVFPNLFLYAQSEYWNNGFLKYWSLNNVPNFLFAFPTIVIHVNAIYYYYVAELPKLRKLEPVIIINAFLLILAVFFLNVQILTRISTFLPLSYWYVADLLVSGNKYGKVAVYYMLIWTFLQTSLFAAFLPPA